MTKRSRAAYMREYRQRPDVKEARKATRQQIRHKRKANEPVLMRQIGGPHRQQINELLKEVTTCEICGVAGRLHVDHCHDKMLVRGIVCHSCNVGLGHFRDNPELLKKAAKYLTHNQTIKRGLIYYNYNKRKLERSKLRRLNRTAAAE